MAISFDGTSDYLKLDNTPVINHSSFDEHTYQFSISCWFRPEGRQGGASVWEQYDGSGNEGRLELYFTSGGALRFKRKGSYNNVAGAITTSTTDWYHVLCTITKTTFQTYINGDNGTEKSATASSDHSNSSVDFKIGSGTAEGDFEGEIAEWAVWKTVLTAGEKDSLYHGASPLFVRPSDLISYYPLGGPYVPNSTGATNAYRDIISGNNLSSNGDPAFLETPTQFSGRTSSGMFYPLSSSFETALASSSSQTPAVESSTYVEQNITGDDVIHEIIQANPRQQGGITVNSGGKFFKHRDTGENELEPYRDQDNNWIVAENYIQIMNNRLSYKNRTNQQDEINGGGPNTGS